MMRTACTECGGSCTQYKRNGDSIWQCVQCGKEFVGAAPKVSDKVADPFNRNSRSGYKRPTEDEE